ncbi:MAG: hypothetical protein IKP46_07490 [Bacteroidales bacterium]|nr:hypothetical protein [Bacteroidales bacterium]
MKLRTTVWLITAAALALACAKEQNDGEAVNPSGKAEETSQQALPGVEWDGEYLVSFSAGIEGLDTRVSISAEGVTAFESGDAVLVHVTGGECPENGVQYVYDATKDRFKVASDATPVRVLSGETASIYYPYGAFTMSAGNAVFALPSEISGLSDLGDKNPMAARAQLGDADITFRNLATVIRVDLLGNVDDCQSIQGGTVKLSCSNAALALGEAYTVDWSGEYPAFTANAGSDAASHEITVTYSTALDPDTATSFYFLAPYVASGNIEGLTVTAENGGNTYTRTRSAFDRASARNKIIYMSFRAGTFYDGAGTEGDPYQVKTVDDWCNISRLGTAGLDKHYKQVADIDFSFGGKFSTDGKADISAFMIGEASSVELRFSGSYDGQGFKLQNFSLSGNAVNTGLWKASQNARFTNIHIDNATVSSTAGWVGALVANQSGNGSVMENCVVTHTTVSGSNNVGGLSGRTFGTVSNCSFGAEGEDVSVNGTTQVGGIIGIHQGTGNVTGCVNYGAVNCSDVRGGGIIGVVTEESTVSDCDNYGAVGTAANYKGGIIGSFYCQTAGKTLTITNAVNHGTVTGQSGVGGIIGGTDNASAQADGVYIVINGVTLNDKDATVTGGNTNVGGIIGYPNKTTLTIGGTSCTNKAAVTGKTNVGGIVGNVAVSGTISSCVNEGAVEATITDNNAYAGGIAGLVNSTANITSCINNGNVTAVKSGIGGIVGLCKGGTIDMCMNTAKIYGDVSNSPNVGGIVGCIEGGTAVTVKRCYNSKDAECRGSNRIGGIVGIINKEGSQVVNCATYGRVIGAGNGTNFCAGALVGQCNTIALVANCLTRDLGQMVVATNGSSTNKYLLGYIVGYVAAGATFQSCLVAGVAHHIQDKTTHAGTSGSVNASSSYSGSALSAGDGKTKSILCGKDVSGATFKDMFFRGNKTCPARWKPTNCVGTYSACHWLSTAYNTNYSFNTYAQKAVTLSDGTTTFAANSKYPAEILDAASNLITAYTPVEGEDMGWSDVAIGSNTHYPIPTALVGLFDGKVSE